jgi:peptidoglycan hydrolase CwlO-like protein
MTDSPSAETPIAIDRVDCTRSDRDGVDLRLTGRWLNGAEHTGTDLMLVVQVQGRRHRFAAERDSHPLATDAWEATFRIPPWAQPRHEGQAALWVGTSVVPVPLPGASGDGAGPHHRLPAPPPLGEARAWPPDLAPPPTLSEVGAGPGDVGTPPALSEARGWPPDVAPPPADADRSRLSENPDPAVDTGRTGPLAELLFKESVSALHAELEQRSAEVARLQGSLADAVSELEARTSRQAALESAHGDLRGELQELMSAVTVQRDEYERRLSEAEGRAAAAEADCQRVHSEHAAERGRTAAQLADLSAARDAAAAEAADLRDRLGAAASGRQHHAADLSALRDQLAAAQVSRDAAAGEVAGLRAELERLGSELAITREHQSAQGADLGEAQRLLAEARSLSEQLRSQSPH